MLPRKPQLGLERPLLTLPQGAHPLPHPFQIWLQRGMDRKNFTGNKVKVRVLVRSLPESRSRDQPQNASAAGAERFSFLPSRLYYF